MFRAITERAQRTMRVLRLESDVFFPNISQKQWHGIGATKKEWLNCIKTCNSNRNRNEHKHTKWNGANEKSETIFSNAHSKCVYILLFICISLLMKDNTKSATQINTNLPIEIDIEQTMQEFKANTN